MIFKEIKRFRSTSASFSDVLICGGGLIGTTLACLLAKHPSFIDKSITLIEASPEQEFAPSDTYSNRVSAISPFSRNLLTRLGIWKHVHRFKEVYKLNIWGAFSDNFLELDNKGEGVAYIIENSDLIQAATNTLHSLSNLQLVYKKNISNVVIDKVNSNSLPKIVLNDGKEYICQLLIGADGVNSMIRKAMDVNYLSWDYQQMAIVATLKVSECCPNSIAWQKFLPEGPIALLPLTHDLSSLVWSTTKEKAKNLLNMADENFVDALNQSLQTQIPNELVKAVNNGMNGILNKFGIMSNAMAPGIPPMIYDVIKGSRAAFPLGFGHCASYVCSNVVLVGDAAHRVHPLAGQGVNLGFKDIEYLEKTLSDGLTYGRNLGEIDDLRKYEMLCQRNNIPVMVFIDLIHRVYTTNLGPMQALGDVCFQVANICNPIKEQINTKALFLRI